MADIFCNFVAVSVATTHLSVPKVTSRDLGAPILSLSLLLLLLLLLSLLLLLLVVSLVLLSLLSLSLSSSSSLSFAWLRAEAGQAARAVGAYYII